jgi:hypothetical protein
MDNPITLTVVVVDAQSQPKEGASVSITPSDATLKTNSSGEVQFKLGTAKKYEITAKVGSSEVTVPYYVTADGATRLVVNPVYVKTVEKQLHRSEFFKSIPAKEIGIGLGVVILFVVIWKFFKRKRRRIKKSD